MAYLLVLILQIQFTQINSKKKTISCILQPNQLVRQQFMDVLSKNQDGLIQNARIIVFSGDINNITPFKLQPYYINTPSGWTEQLIGQNLIVQLLQYSQINTIKFWLYDRHNFIRTYNLQVFIMTTTNKKLLVYDSIQADGLVTTHFKAQFDKQLIFYNRGGGSVNQYIHFIKIQAYFKLF